MVPLKLIQKIQALLGLQDSDESGLPECQEKYELGNMMVTDTDDRWLEYQKWHMGISR